MVKLIGDLCGHIYVTPNKSFIHYCTFCEKLFDCWQDFQDHNITEHFENNLQKQIKINFIPILSQSDGLHNKSKESGLFQDRNILELDDEKLHIREGSDLNDDNTNESTCSENSVCKAELTEISEKSCEFKHSEGVLESDEESDSQSSTNHFSNADKTLRCTFCSKLFRKEVNLEEHTKKHLNYGLMCEICGKHWKTKYDLERHRKMHLKMEYCENGSAETENLIKQTELTDIKELESDDKSSEFKDTEEVLKFENSDEKCDSESSTNYFSDQDESLCCTFCYKQFRTETSLDEHIKKHLNYSLTCEICGKHYRNMYELQRHKNIHLKQNFSDIENSDGETEFGEIEKLDSDEENFDFENDMKIIQAQNSNEECDSQISINLQFMGKDNLDENIKKHLNYSLTCEICDKHFDTEFELQNHKKNHLMKYENGGTETENFDRETELTEIKELESDEESAEFKNDKQVIKAEKSDKESDPQISINNLSNTEDNLRCNFCLKQFTMKTCLNEHIKNHLNFKLSCEVCGKHCKTKSDLQRHMPCHKKIKCTVCEYRCLPDQFDAHMKKHEKEDENLRCKFCRQNFSNKTYLDEHTKRHLNYSLTCEICKKHFKRKNDLTSHIDTHFKKKRNVNGETYADNAIRESDLAEIRELEKNSEFNNLNNETIQNENSDKELNSEISFFHRCTFCTNKFSDKSKFDEHVQNHLNNSLACDNCGKHCKTKSDLERHRLIHLRIKCSLCEYRCLPDQLDNHMEKHKQANEDESLRCTFCFQQFSKKTNLDDHTKLHLNYILTCKICGKHSKDQRSLWRHKKTHLKKNCSICNVSIPRGQFEKHMKGHTIAQCKYCSKIFKCQFRLNKHIRIHTGERPFKCEACPLAFAEKGNLTRHVYTAHTGDEKNFICKSCHTKFKTKQLRDMHYRRVHLKEKRHICEFCGRKFAGTGQLLVHKRKQHIEYDKRPHPCKICDKKFVESQNLTEHMNTHTGEKPFQCEICLKNFASKKSLRGHKILHTGEKNHVCKICGKAYAQRASCANHMKQQHMIAPLNSDLLS